MLILAGITNEGSSFSPKANEGCLLLISQPHMARFSDTPYWEGEHWQRCYCSWDILVMSFHSASEGWPSASPPVRNFLAFFCQTWGNLISLEAHFLICFGWNLLRGFRVVRKPATCECVHMHMYQESLSSVSRVYVAKQVYKWANITVHLVFLPGCCAVF